MANVAVDAKIWVIKKGNGAKQVHPSPKDVTHGSVVEFTNLTGTDLTVVFPPGRSLEDRLSVSAGSSATLTVQGGSGYFEYDVQLSNGEYAEGHSKAGMIVE